MKFQYIMTEDFSYELKIPQERVAVLIGKNGDIKKALKQIQKPQSMWILRKGIYLSQEKMLWDCIQQER
jgi:rRNA processing protein Krr1/Pno1